MNKAEIYLDLLVQMIAIPAISRHEDTRAAFLQKWLEKRGHKVRRNGNNLIVSRAADISNAEILLNSHIDTVSATGGWESDPFIPVRKNGRITGLGSNDAGASVVSLVAAYEVLAELDQEGKLVLVLSAEEEISGKQGIGSVLPDLPQLKFAVVGEPTVMQPAVAERGLMVLDAVAIGKAGHAARGEGVNAIYKAMEDLKNIQELTFNEESDWLTPPSVNVTMINSGTAHNVIPDSCEYVIDVRSNDCYSNDRLLKILQETCKAEIRPRSMRLRSSFLQASHPIFRIFDGLELEPFGSPTLSDMALMSFPAVKIGPGDSARSHTANEYIGENEIEDAIEIYEIMIGEILKLQL